MKSYSKAAFTRARVRHRNKCPHKREIKLPIESQVLERDLLQSPVQTPVRLALWKRKIFAGYNTGSNPPLFSCMLFAHLLLTFVEYLLCTGF